MRRSTRLFRSSSETLVASQMPAQVVESQGAAPKAVPRVRKKRTAPAADSDAFESSASDPEDPKPVVKKQKTSRSTSKRSNGTSETFSRLFGADAPSTPLSPCALPGRRHTLFYHHPLLLDQSDSRASLLKWFDNTSTTRGMPWRKSWINPSSISDPVELRQQLEKRAYEVWISEIMLQQTRVAVVIEYWNRWMAKWPTIHDLAAATPDDVLAMWRGLGYYSRATRIHEAAKLVCGDADMKGLLPQDVVELEKKVPGVGRYTAGAITAIVFGKASPMVDGNVLRVLSRQLGVLGDVKTDKTTIDMLWMAAEALVRAIAKDEEIVGQTGGLEEKELKASDRPGRWGQALMELGSTVCTPKPNCASCPITATCRAYGEGLLHATKKGSSKQQATTDIEDACTLCKPFEEYAELEEDDDQKPTKASSKSKTATAVNGSKKQASLQSFFFPQQTQSSKTKTASATKASEPEIDAATIEKISNHARKFPVKTIKKAVREEETLVCAIQRKSDGQYLIQKRPEKGLLAGLWEFPSKLLPETDNTTTKVRKGEATKFVEELLEDHGKLGIKHVGELGGVPWLFSHIKLTMHVHLFVLLDGDSDHSFNGEIGKRTRWTADVDGESMGTGMRKCWSMVQDAEE